MAGKGTLTVRVISDTKAAEKGVKDLRGEFNSLAQSASSSLSPALSQAYGHLQKIATAAGGGNTAMLAIGAGAAATGIALGDMALHGVSSFVNLANEIRGVKNVMGGTAEEASKVVAVAKMTGVSTDAAAAGFFRLSQNVEKHTSVLQADGVEIERNSQGHIDLMGTLTSVADAYKKAGKGAEGNKILMDAFGRSGAALIPILVQSKQALAGFVSEAEKHHEIMSDADLQKARQYAIATKELSGAFSGLERELAIGVIPVLTDLAKAATTAFDAVDEALHFGGFDTLPDSQLKKFPKAFYPVKKAAEEVGVAFSRTAEEQKAYDKASATTKAELDKLHGALDAASESTSELSSAQKDAAASATSAGQAVADAHKKVADATKALHDAETRASDIDVAHAAQSVAEARQAQSDATKKVGTAQAALNRIEKDGGRAEVEAAKAAAYAARKSAIDADRQANAARKNLDDARAELQRLQSGVDPKDRADAEQAIAGALYDQDHANRAVRDAIEGQAAAQQKLNDARSDPTASPADLASAERDLRDATEGVSDAQHDAAQSAQRVADARQAEADLTVKNAQDITSAQDDVAAATLAVRDAQAAAFKAQQDAATAQAAIAAATVQHSQDEQQAYLDVRDAMNGATDAALALRDAQKQQQDVERQGTASDPAVVRAKQDVRDATKDLSTALQVQTWWTVAAKNATDDLVTKLLILRTTYPELAAEINAIIAATGVPVQQGPFIAPTHRAGGGPVTKGRPYIVGENRPELFVPSENGAIAPSVDGGNVTHVVHVNLNGAIVTDRRSADRLVKLLGPSIVAHLVDRARTNPNAIGEARSA